MIAEVIPSAPAPNVETIALLGHLLKLAEKGDLQGIFTVGIHADGCYSSAWKGLGKKNISALGAIEDAKLDFWTTQIEHR